jgi:iduronate 2-sulfatase
LPFVFPEKFLQLYPAPSVQLPSNPFAPAGMPDIAWQAYGETRSYADIKKLNATGAINSTLPDATVLALRRAYYSAVSYTDDNIGQLLAELKAQGLADSTIVAFWGDHGWHLGTVRAHSTLSLDRVNV